MSTRYSTGNDDERAAAVKAAADALQDGKLVVLPTDTVYGLAADAFDKGAVNALLAAKGRSRKMPPPVLISNAATLQALATRVPDWVSALVDELWPGPFTVVLHQQPSLQWDLGENRGTVAIRMPDDAIAREVIDNVGPLAVSSANRTRNPAATTADAAEVMLHKWVEAIVDGGESTGGEASTIVDATSDKPRLLRAGAVSIERLNELLAPFDLTVVDPKAEDSKAGDSDTDTGDAGDESSTDDSAE